MPSAHDREFVQIAMDKGYLTRDAARAMLQRLGLAEKNQARLSLEKLMVMEELLLADQVAEIQAEQHRKLVFCPCGQKTNVFDFQSGTRVKCKSCGRIFEVP